MPAAASARLEEQSSGASPAAPDRPILLQVRGGQRSARDSRSLALGGGGSSTTVEPLLVAGTSCGQGLAVHAAKTKICVKMPRITSQDESAAAARTPGGATSPISNSAVPDRARLGTAQSQRSARDQRSLTLGSQQGSALAQHLPKAPRAHACNQANLVPPGLHLLGRGQSEGSPLAGRLCGYQAGRPQVAGRQPTRQTAGRPKSGGSLGKAHTRPVPAAHLVIYVSWSLKFAVKP